MKNSFYVRTDEGQSAAYDATSAMPRKLKSLLKVIDGKTSLAVFAGSLKAFGDVQGLLNSLQAAGLIEIKDGGSNSQATQPKAAPSLTSQSANAAVGIASAQEGLISTIASKMGVRSGRAREAADGFAMTMAIHTQNQTIFEPRVQTQELQADRQQNLQLLVQDMSSFVLAYVPEQSFGVLSELEAINTFEELGVLLGGYELMVRHVGEPARIHLMHVRQILGKWL